MCKIQKWYKTEQSFKSSEALAFFFYWIVSALITCSSYIYVYICSFRQCEHSVLTLLLSWRLQANEGNLSPVVIRLRRIQNNKDDSHHKLGQRSFVRVCQIGRSSTPQAKKKNKTHFLPNNLSCNWKLTIGFKYLVSPRPLSYNRSSRGVVDCQIFS